MMSREMRGTRNMPDHRFFHFRNREKSVTMKRIVPFLVVVLFSLSTCSFNSFFPDIEFFTPEGEVQVSFSVTADMRSYTGPSMDHFRGVCQTIASGGPGAFMISPGDIDPPAQTYSAIKTWIGDEYPWYPVVGNHEAETEADMEWLRAFNMGAFNLPNIVNAGPPGCEETSYSFDYGDVHFVVLNEYYDGNSDHGTDGDVVDTLYEWLLQDLTANTKPIVLVFGHEPAYPQPDQESGRLRHESDSLNAHQENRDRFWNLLKTHSVVAYICGHTHNYSAVQLNGVWQIDASHARGTGDMGSRSSFVMLYVTTAGDVFYYTYRLDYFSNRYTLADSGQLR